ncbi:FAD/NAD(P)-binding domain-containing protein [Cadophora sp. DSE1049]|nr:FAD/NAD(P)-binding domain-containing protein [Cadophora sp. DSE1049]
MNPVTHVLIIGGGPAGLGAALGLGRVCRSALVFDSQEYRNDGVIAMSNVLSHDGENPSIFRSRTMEDIMSKYPHVKFMDRKITSATTESSPAGSTAFRLVDHKGNSWVGKKLLLATGSVDILPTLPGYRELWGHNIYHCLFCDGYERRGEAIGVVGAQARDVDHLLMAFSFAPKRLVVYTNGEVPDNEETTQHLENARTRGCSIDTRRIQRLSKAADGVSVQLHFDDKSSDIMGSLIHHPPTLNRAQALFDQLGLEIAAEQGGHVNSKSPFGETNIPGCFVAGDTSTRLKIVSVAAASGQCFKPSFEFYFSYPDSIVQVC